MTQVLAKEGGNVPEGLIGEHTYLSSEVESNRFLFVSRKDIGNSNSPTRKLFERLGVSDTVDDLLVFLTSQHGLKEKLDSGEYTEEESSVWKSISREKQIQAEKLMEKGYSPFTAFLEIKPIHMISFEQFYDEILKAINGTLKTSQRRWLWYKTDIEGNVIRLCLMAGHDQKHLITEAGIAEFVDEGILLLKDKSKLLKSKVNE